jgi:hypothetical protein
MLSNDVCLSYDELHINGQSSDQSVGNKIGSFIYILKFEDVRANLGTHFETLSFRQLAIIFSCPSSALIWRSLPWWAHFIFDFSWKHQIHIRFFELLCSSLSYGLELCIDSLLGHFNLRHCYSFGGAYGGLWCGAVLQLRVTGRRTNFYLK